MKAITLALVVSLSLLAVSCSGGSGGSSGSGGSGASFEVTISGAMERQESGTSAIVYDMAGFTHVGMHAGGGTFQIDFNTKGTERPGVGVIELTTSNLRGWMGSVEVRDESGTTSYDATGGTLEIIATDGSSYSGRFAFKARNADGPGPSGEIDVSGSFEAREK